MRLYVIIFALLCLALIGLGLLIAGIFVFRHFRQQKPASPLSPQPPLASPPVIPATVALQKCPQCHLPLAPNAPEGLCPACLAKVALGSEPAAAPGPTLNVNPLAEAAPPRVAPDPAQLAAQFPQLEIIELLGMGGMGMVYKVRQPRLDRIVALKILPVESDRGPSFAERFGREAKALAKLNHPGIVNIYDFGQTGQYYYFIMEYVDGMNLRHLLHNQPLEPRQALELVTQICTALQFAHDEGVVHRDIKPENILLNKKGQVKIADFGLAKLLGTAPDTALTMSQAAMGTLNYMAPEQRQNAQAVDHRADIYSLGVVFYEMLTGEVPMGRFEAPSKRVQVDVRLDEVVLKALEREPARRYQQVSEVKTNVENISSTTPASSPTGPTSATPVPTFMGSVVKPLVIPLLLLLALFPFALNSPLILDLIFFLAVGLVIAGIPSAVFEWRRKLASQGLTLKQLSPAVRRRGISRVVAAAVPCAAALIGGMWFFPSRYIEWREESFYPKSHAFEKLGLSGNISGYKIPFWSDHTVAGSGTMALKIFRKDSSPAVLTFTLPGLVLQNASSDPGQGPGVNVLTQDLLTNWLHENAHLDLSQPQAQTEARQIMEVFQPYYEASPGSWQKFADEVKAKLQDFDLAEIKMNFGQGGIFGLLFFAWVGYAGFCICVFCFLALGVLKRTYAEARVEIEAGRWTPPNVEMANASLRLEWVLKRSTLIWILCGFMVALICGIIGVMEGRTGTTLLILVSLGILIIVAFQLHSRQKIKEMSDRGLWPRLGDLPNLEQVKALAQAGEKVLAIKLYRQMRGVPLADAKAAVEKLVGQAPAPRQSETPRGATPPANPVSSQLRLSRAALIGVVWAPWCLLASLYFGAPAGTVPTNGWLHGALMFSLLPLGLTAPFGTTILGYVALSHIRHSTGRLHGLGLALFDLLLFPILFLDGAVFLFLVVAGVNPNMAGFYWGVGSLISLLLDFFIVRKVWRFFNR